MGSGAKSYMRKGFLIFEEMRIYFTIFEEVVISDFAPDPSEFPYICGKFSFLFYQYTFVKNCYNNNNNGMKSNCKNKRKRLSDAGQSFAKKPLNYVYCCSARDWDGKDYLRIIPRVVW